MGKKDKKKNTKKKTILSLAEFNDKTGGEPPELAALPSAPKAPEQWEEEGGRPEYNSRGYREKQSSTRAGTEFRRRSGIDSDYSSTGPFNNNNDSSNFDDHDWHRRGPIDNNPSTSFGSQAEERDWGGMRRGPLDHSKDHHDQQDRDWGGMRRGPVDSSFRNQQSFDETNNNNNNNNIERDWSQRRGPLESNSNNSNNNNENNTDWGLARGGNVIDARFESNNHFNETRDWTQRKGPVEADTVAELTSSFGQNLDIDDDDWSAARKGPIESEFEQKNANLIRAEQRNWNERKPVEAVVRSPERKENKNENGATTTIEDNDDWSERRGPVEAEIPAETSEPVEKDWSGMRSGEGVGAVKTIAEEEIIQESHHSNAETVAKADTEESWTRRGPIRSRAEEEEERAAAGQDHVNERSGRARRGNRNFNRRYNSEDAEDAVDGEGQEDRGSWRREGNGIAPRGRKSRGGRTQPIGNQQQFGFGHEQGQQGQERDWGAARRNASSGREAKPVATEDVQVAASQDTNGDLETVDNVNSSASTEHPPNDSEVPTEGVENAPSQSAVLNKAGEGNNDDDEWTTVRANPKKEARMARRSIGANANVGSGRRDSRWRGGGSVNGGNRRFSNRARGGRPQAYNTPSGERNSLNESSNIVNNNNVEDMVRSKVSDSERHSSPVTPVLET